MAAHDPQPASYTLGGTEDERERLVAQATLFDRTTERYLREAGLAPGKRVLDLGTGMGDVALIAASIVGGEGRGVGGGGGARTLAAPPGPHGGLGGAESERGAGGGAAAPGG